MPSNHYRNPFVNITKNSSKRSIDLDQIIRLEADINYTSLFTATDNYIIAKTLKDFEESLDPKQFIRTHKSHIINKNHIEKVLVKTGERKVLLKSGETVEIARRRLKEVIRSINPY